ERHAIPRRGLPSRRDGELPRAPGLVAWRRGSVLARAAGRVVRPRAREQVARALGPGEAEVDERRIPAPASRRGARRSPRTGEAGGLQVRRGGDGPGGDDRGGQGQVPAPRRPREFPHDDGAAVACRRSPRSRAPERGGEGGAGRVDPEARRGGTVDRAQREREAQGNRGRAKGEDAGGDDAV